MSATVYIPFPGLIASDVWSEEEIYADSLSQDTYHKTLRCPISDFDKTWRCQAYMIAARAMLNTVSWLNVICFWRMIEPKKRFTYKTWKRNLEPLNKWQCRIKTRHITQITLLQRHQWVTGNGSSESTWPIRWLFQHLDISEKLSVLTLRNLFPLMHPHFWDC